MGLFRRSPFVRRWRHRDEGAVMKTEIDAYTGAGLLHGRVSGPDRLADLLETLDALAFERPTLDPIDGGPRESQSRAVVETDDLMLVVCPPETPTPVHASWHPLSLAIGPFQVAGELPTLPGYDPGRSLTRPGGPFVMLGKVTIALRQAPDAGQAEHPFAWINRYAVEAYEADIELGAFFPGATPIKPHATAPIAAPV
jgi:hypothetical protein